MRKLTSQLQRIARERADDEARRIPWQRLYDARNQYVNWQEFNLWARSILEVEGRVPDWLAEILNDRCPGFLRTDEDLMTKAAKNKPLPLRLEDWIDDHIFGFAKQEGWFNAIAFYAVREPRYQRAEVCWSECVAKWKKVKPIQYSSFDEWKDAAAHCDDTARLLPVVKKPRASAKLVAPDRLAEAVSRWIDWEALAYWARPAFELRSGLRTEIASELERRCPGFLAANSDTRLHDSANESRECHLSKGEVMARYQNGWLQKKPRKSGDIWVFCYRRQRPEDGAWVQATAIKVGNVKEYPSEEAAWRRVEELHLNPNQSPFEVGAQLLFGELATHYIQKELPEDQRQATIEKAYSTIRKYKRYLSRWVLPRWGATPALAVHPPQVEDWLRELKNKFALRNPTLGEIRKAMNNVYVHGQRQGFLPRTPDGNPIGFVRQSLASDFEPVILTLPQVLDILDTLDLMRRTMVITDAATALRVSEVLALKWYDLDFTDQLIRVRRAYVERRFGPPKSKASKAPVPMHPLLAAHLLAWRKETLYPNDKDLVFPSLRLKGERPPAANMLVADYLRVAAKKAGVVAPPRTFGFHTFRRTLASVLVKMRVDVKTVQEILRHQNLKTTLEIYAKSMSEDSLKAQGMFLELLFSHRRTELIGSGLVEQEQQLPVNCR